LAAQITEEDAQRFWAIIDEQPGIEATVDLQARTATLGDLTVPFQIDDYTRWRLLEGLDDIALTLRDEAQITEFENGRASWLPLTLPAR
jgi:3-isopropylmalate/(R)-2-methylmalate dehydratase small subunit